MSGSDNKFLKPSSSKSKTTQTRPSSFGSRKTCEPLLPCCFRFSAPFVENAFQKRSKSSTFAVDKTIWHSFSRPALGLVPTLLRAGPRGKSKRTARVSSPGEVLLRQPGGFEGVGPVFSEVGPPDGLAIAERPQVPDTSLNLSTARLAAAAEADQHEHLVACVDQLFDFQPRPIRPGRNKVAIEGAHFIGPTKHHGVHEPPRQINNEIRWKLVPGLGI